MPVRPRSRRPRQGSGRGPRRRGIGDGGQPDVGAARHRSARCHDRRGRAADGARPAQAASRGGRGRPSGRPRRRSSRPRSGLPGSGLPRAVRRKVLDARVRAREHLGDPSRVRPSDIERRSAVRMVQSDDLTVAPLVPDRGTTHDQPVTDASPQPGSGPLLSLSCSGRGHGSRLPAQAPGRGPPETGSLVSSTVRPGRPAAIGAESPGRGPFGTAPGGPRAAS